MIGERSWEITFSDILMLLLTFLIFIISVSVFKTDEYKKFWQEYKKGNLVNSIESMATDKSSAESNEIDPFPELDVPKLSRNAAQILRETGEIIDETQPLSDAGIGDNIVYDENKISLMISEKIGFGSGEVVLQEGFKSFLQKLIPALKRSDFPVNIVGHTDSTGSDKVNNVELSLDRALEIADYLIKNGLEARKVSVSGYGPYRPVFSNLTEEGRQKNRRVQIVILPNSS